MNKLTSLIFLLLSLFTIDIAIAQEKSVDNEIIVELDDQYNYSDLVSFINQREYTITIVKPLGQHSKKYLLSTTENEQTEVIRFLSKHDIFQQVIPNTRVTFRSNPNDTVYTYQWNLPKINTEKAWNYTTGGTSIDGDEIVVAVLDDGFFLDHEDLAQNIYNNPYDQPGDMNGDGCPGDCGFDDDGDGLIDEDNFGREPGDAGYDNSFKSDDDENGYKDDTHGIYAITGDSNHPKRPHGTSVSGIIGASGNNETGIAGINWNVKILPLSIKSQNDEVIENYEYIKDMRKRYNESSGTKGAFVVACNTSLGIDNSFPTDQAMWCEMYDKMGEVGILNSVATTNQNINVDVEGDIPSLCQSKYLIAVTSTDIDDTFGERGFGKENIDIAAPGEGAWSITPTHISGYGTFTGTSAAAPHVAGAIGLIYSSPCENFLNYFKKNPSKVDSLAKIIIESGHNLENLDGLVKSSKRLDIFSALREVALFCNEGTGELAIAQLFPNPVKNTLYFDFDADPREEIYVEIYNILGQKMSSEVIIFPLFEKSVGSVNTERLTTGMYFLSLNQGKKRVALKFFKE